MTGFSSKVWGPSAWLFLHIVTMSYDPSRKSHYKKFFHSLQHVLPCKKCRINYSNIISNGPLKLKNSNFSNKSSLSSWLFKVHDKVQYDIYKSSSSSFDKPIVKSVKFWSNFYNKFKGKCNKYGCFSKKFITTITISKYFARKAQTSIKIK